MGRSISLGDGLQAVRSSVNQTFAQTEPWKLIAVSMAAAWALKSLNDTRYHELRMSSSYLFFSSSRLRARCKCQL